jgi:hypothetical protein
MCSNIIFHDQDAVDRITFGAVLDLTLSDALEKAEYTHRTVRIRDILSLVFLPFSPLYQPDPPVKKRFEVFKP